VNPASPYDPTTPINAVKCGEFTIPIIKTDHMVCIGSFFFRCYNDYNCGMDNVNQLMGAVIGAINFPL